MAFYACKHRAHKSPWTNKNKHNNNSEIFTFNNKNRSNPLKSSLALFKNILPFLMNCMKFYMRTKHAWTNSEIFTFNNKNRSNHLKSSLTSFNTIMCGAHFVKMTKTKSPSIYSHKTEIRNAFFCKLGNENVLQKYKFIEYKKSYVLLC